MAYLSGNYNGGLYGKQDDLVFVICSESTVNEIFPFQRYKNDQLRYVSSIAWKTDSEHKGSVKKSLFKWLEDNTLGKWNISLTSVNGKAKSFFLTFEDENEQMLFDLRFS